MTSNRPWHPLFSDERAPAALAARNAGMVIEEYDESGRVHWIASLDGTPNPVAGMAIELLSRDDAFLVSALAAALRETRPGEVTRLVAAGGES